MQCTVSADADTFGAGGISIGSSQKNVLLLGPEDIAVNQLETQVLSSTDAKKVWFGSVLFSETSEGVVSRKPLGEKSALSFKVAGFSANGARTSNAVWFARGADVSYDGQTVQHFLEKNVAGLASATCNGVAIDFEVISFAGVELRVDKTTLKHVQVCDSSGPKYRSAGIQVAGRVTSVRTKAN